MLQISEQCFSSRLLLGTGKFASAQLMKDAVQVSGSGLVTLALKRLDFQQAQDDILTPLQQLGVKLLPNTAGARSAREAIFAARVAREALGTNWLKLEVHPDPQYLLPDPIETLEAARQLVEEGFIVLSYCHADPVLCKRLEEVGCSAVMPLASPIGSNQGLKSREFLEIIIEQSQVPVIVDAGIGRPSDAVLALEMGADAVLVNTAIATASDPVAMAKAFAEAVSAGERAHQAGIAGTQPLAQATSPMTEFLEAL